MNGVTRSVICKAAEEISLHPELVFMKRCGAGANDGEGDGDGNRGYGDSDRTAGSGGGTNNAGFVYFDPSYCWSSSSWSHEAAAAISTSSAVAAVSPGTTASGAADITTVCRTYRALGRLIGLCLVKHKHGVSLPTNFPRTSYQCVFSSGRSAQEGNCPQ